MPDLNQITLKKPGKPCATRWIARIHHFEYLREYGVLIFRFLCCSNCKPINLPLLYNCLVQLPEILFLLNVVNNSLETLAFEKKATAHLVLPILEELKKFFLRNPWLTKVYLKTVRETINNAKNSTDEINNTTNHIR